MKRISGVELFLWAIFFVSSTVFGTDAYSFWQKRPSVKVTNVTVPGFENVKIQARLFQPNTMLDSQKPRPTVLLISPWSVGIVIYETKARELAKHGYQVLAYSSRGWAGSEGEIDTGGPLDVADASRLIDWLIDVQHADPYAIGAAGISLGAGTALMAAAYDERIRAVASLSGWSDLYTSIFGNTTERFVWGNILDIASKVGGGKFPHKHHDTQKEALKNRDIASLREYTDVRSPIHLIDRFRQNQTAIFISHNIQDFLFPSYDIWDFFQKLESPKAIRLQPGIHASTEVVEVFGIGYEVWDDLISWFDLWLTQQTEANEWLENSIQIRPLHDNTKLQFGQDSLERAVPERLFLSSAASRWKWGKLTAFDDDLQCCDSFTSNKNSGINSGVPLVYPLLNSFIPLETNINPLFIRRNRAAVYQMEVATQTFDILGIPRVHLNLSSSHESGQIVVHLFRVDERGKWHLISLAPYSYYDQTPGEVFPLNISLFNGFSTISTGDRLVLAIDSYDLQFSPVHDEAYEITIHTDLGSYLDLPVSFR
ncbi:MAG: alpha/beta fold hydrolase [Oligoflexus sp.]